MGARRARANAASGARSLSSSPPGRSILGAMSPAAAPTTVPASFRLAAAVMTALFVVSAALQWNDPDPAYWIAIYGVSALLAARAAQRQLPFVPNVAALVVFALLALRALPDLLGARSSAFTQWEMRDAGAEAAREAGGLWICALWSGLQTAFAFRARPRSEPPIGS